MNIEDLDSEKLVEILGKRGIELEEVDIVFGGPPCEGFSQNRSSASIDSQRNRVNKFVEDPRNRLFKEFIRIVNIINPKIVLMENVIDLVRHRDGETMAEIFREFEDIGYHCMATVLNSADFGVPQIRRRAFFIAYKNDSPQDVTPRFPKPTHLPFPQSETNDKLLVGDSGYWINVWEAIGDLSSNSLEDFLYRPGEELTNIRRYYRAGQSEKTKVMNHEFRRLGKNSLEKVVSLTGKSQASEMPDDIRPQSHYHYSYMRLKWGEPSRTITKFVYHVGSGMFAHPTEDRALTMREAARLQTFPDNYGFYSNQIRSLSSLIGSAVPPLLGQRLAIEIVQYLDSLNSKNHNLKSIRTDAVAKRMENTLWSSKNQSKKLF